jgi:branched-chain amino acid transport system substrate-binding protein
MGFGHLRRGLGVVASAIALATVATACSNSSGSASGGGSSAPGVSSNSITVGSLATLSGPLSSMFGDIVYGVKAYFDMVNASGGVNGRKIDLAKVDDDTGNPTTDADDERNLVQQDHIFALVGVGSPFFSSTYLCQSGTPTFGYVVIDNWHTCPNLFGAYGSTLDYSTGQPSLAYLAKQLNVQSAAVVAYNIAAASKDACASYIQGLQKYGVHVGFQDLNLGYAADPTPDVQHMVAAHTDFLLTCTDEPESLKFVQSMHQYGLNNVHTVWLTGYDRSLVAQNQSIMTNSIFSLQHVPFEAPTLYPGKYPGMAQYIQVMNKYEPQWTYNDLAIQGWINAAQFVAGLKAVGKGDLTQQKLVSAINAMKGYNADGIMPPIEPDWATAHTTAAPPFCNSYVGVMSGGTLKPILVQNGDETLVCFNQNSDTPIQPLPANVPPNT